MIPIARDEDDDCVSCVVDEILACYKELSQCLDLKPSPSTNSLFEVLVELCSQVHSEGITAQVCRLVRLVRLVRCRK